MVEKDGTQTLHACQVIVRATSLQEMARVMNVLMPRLQWKAAEDQISQVVRTLLGA